MPNNNRTVTDIEVDEDFAPQPDIEVRAFAAGETVTDPMFFASGSNIYKKVPKQTVELTKPPNGFLILVHASPSSMAEEISDKLEGGYLFRGGLHERNGTYTQEMILPEYTKATDRNY